MWHEDQAQLVVYEPGYQATGWRNTGDAILANTAAADAREHAGTGRLELQQRYLGSQVAPRPTAA